MVRIICRIKPPKEDNIELASDSKVYLYKRSKNLLCESIIKPYQFELDRFYNYDILTREIYEKEVKDKLFNNFGIFIYGHTGSGKTFTMFGNETNKGLFDMISEDLQFDYELEAIDIRHNGNYDLFSESKVILYSDGKKDNCYNSTKKKITKENFDYFKSKILNSRTIGKSKHNETSSRSHLVLYLYKDNKKYTVVDLAGNERKPLIFDKNNEIETSFINSSLLALKECFRSYGKSYMPYRRSDLTRLLKDIINSKNLIICTIHSGFPYFYDSVDTLNYIYGLINKVKTKPDFYEKKVMPLSPKELPKINKRYLPKSPKKYIADRKAVSSKLFFSKEDIYEKKDILSPKNIKYKKFDFDDISSDDLESPELSLKDIDEKDYNTDYLYNDEFEEECNESNYELELLESQEKKPTLKKEVKESIDEKDVYIKKKNEIIPKRFNSEEYYKVNDDLDNIFNSKFDIETKKKLIGIINNLMYKKVISNYKILLDENFDEDSASKLIISTGTTFDICLRELLKLIS
jgi:hypothetical protein